MPVAHRPSCRTQPSSSSDCPVCMGSFPTAAILSDPIVIANDESATSQRVRHVAEIIRAPIADLTVTFRHLLCSARPPAQENVKRRVWLKQLLDAPRRTRRGPAPPSGDANRDFTVTRVLADTGVPPIQPASALNVVLVGGKVKRSCSIHSTPWQCPTNRDVRTLGYCVCTSAWAVHRLPHTPALPLQPVSANPSDHEQNTEEVARPRR